MFINTTISFSEDSEIKKLEMASCTFCKVSKDKLLRCVCGQAFYCNRECQTSLLEVATLWRLPHVASRLHLEPLL